MKLTTIFMIVRALFELIGIIKKIETQHQVEQVPDDSPDAAPSHMSPKRPAPKQHPKPQGIPGFDPDTGTWKK